MLRFALIFASLLLSFSLSAQSFVEEVSEKSVPTDVRKAVKALGHKGDGNWLALHSDRYVFIGDKGHEILIDGKTNTVLEQTQKIEAPIPASFGETKTNVETAFVGHGYKYLAYGETEMADGDERLAVYLEMQGTPKSLLVIYFDSNSKLVARRLHKMQ